MTTQDTAVHASTKDVVVSMLTENTGQHMLDSGGHYGRNWERNQGRNFDDTPAVTSDFSAWRKQGDEGPGTLQMSITVGVYHWMNHCLELDAELQAELDAYVENEANRYWNWLQVAEEFATHLYEQDRCGAEHEVVNTYNDPDYCWLSQTLQYTKLYLDPDDNYEPTHLLVSVHGGCDVRGGYTAPKAFKLKVEYYQALDFMRAAGVGSSSNTWWLQGFSDLEACSANDVTEELDKLPAYDIAWLESEADNQGLRDAIRKADDDAKTLEHTSLTAGQVEVARGQIEVGKHQLERELRQAALALGAERHEYFVITENRRAWLVTREGEGVNTAELEAFADFM